MTNYTHGVIYTTNDYQFGITGVYESYEDALIAVQKQLARHCANYDEVQDYEELIELVKNEKEIVGNVYTVGATQDGRQFNYNDGRIEYKIEVL